MDTEQIETAGIKPIEPELDRIAAIATLAQLEDEVARLHSEGVGACFSSSAPRRTIRTARR